MTHIPPKAVYDCNIFVQALINLAGPAGRCLQLAREGRVSLIASPYVLAEVREIHAKIPAKYGVTAEQTDELARAIVSFATLVADVPAIYLHPHDPDDSHYVDLAIKGGANLIVSRDRHLLLLADRSRVEAQDFQSRFPTLRILDPVQFLRELEPPVWIKQI
ncbi:MAG TPA: putative toxin-antitoxin system toxin component, PIN family [Tepidisphaeraceae bacterium]|jgi:putative PIN family toxin of toxin-antitoxin system|nr:putative toxin-antitoxin system toxin component, PIN family [Tepidisphaeraceae bacterium]